MNIQRNSLGILSDNEESYISLLSGVLESIDEYCSLMVTRSPESFLFRIAPSSPIYINTLVKEITNLHNLFKIRVDFSKSMKNTCSLSFKIAIFAQNKKTKL
jgi:hypothetical protein